MLNGKVAIVTGGAAGIGRGIVDGLAAQRASVVIADINAAGAVEAAQQLRGQRRDAMSVVVDVSNAAQVQRLVSEALAWRGRIDILVNNAGIVSKLPMIELPEEVWDRLIDINLKGAFLCSQAVAKVMIAAGGGRIVNIASTGAHAGAPGFAAYSASKGGILALSRAMAVEWASCGILVNSLSPGSMDTELTWQARDADPESFALRDRRVPVKRRAQVGDIASAVVFLVGEGAGYITGQDILIDGGVLAQHPGFVE